MNKKLLTGALAAMAFLLPSTAAGQTADFNIIPRPQQVNVSNDAPFTLSAKTVISLGTNSQDMKRNANMLASYIEQATGIRPAIGKGKSGAAIVLTIDKTIAKYEEAYEMLTGKKL